MKVLVTGANGFLGYYLCRDLLAKGHQVIATGRGPCRVPFEGQQQFVYEEMDFTNPFMVHDIFQKTKPDLVIHLGAMSRPDDCEMNQHEAWRVNVEATVSLLMNAAV